MFKYIIKNRTYQIIQSIAFVMLSGFICVYIDFPKCLYLFILICLVIASLFFADKRFTLHAVFKNKAQKVLIRLRKIQKEEHGDAKAISYLRNINPFVFEELILIVLKEQGFSTIPNKKYTGDGGVDGQVYIYGKLWAIQAKRYSSHVKKAHIEEFARLIDRKGFSGGLFVHTGRTGKDIRNSYRNGNLIILSGSILIDFICCPENRTFSHLLGFRGITNNNYF